MYLHGEIRFIVIAVYHVTVSNILKITYKQNHLILSCLKIFFHCFLRQSNHCQKKKKNHIICRLILSHHEVENVLKEFQSKQNSS